MLYDGIEKDLEQVIHESQSQKHKLKSDEEIKKLKSCQMKYSENIFCTESSNFISFLEKHKFSEQIMNNMNSFEGFNMPTKVQSLVIPEILEKKNVICSAPTGSGKTMAYALPIVEMTLRNLSLLDYAPKNESLFCQTFAIVIVHTPFLVDQICSVFEKLVLSTQIILNTASNLVNDENLPIPDILIGTIKDISKCAHSLSKVEFLVVDECDQLFENTKMSHYKDQISNILRKCTSPRLCHSFFSATYSPKLELWAKAYFNEPSCIYVGQKNLTNCFVEQFLNFTGSEYGKILELKKIIKNSSGEVLPLIVFVQSKPRALDCMNELSREFPMLNVACVHSNTRSKQSKGTIQDDDVDDLGRLDNCEKFRDGKIDILVTTNCLSRGMDFPLLKTVINFDIPTSEKDYIHRVGRASRGGKIGGKSFTFFTTTDAPYLHVIARQILTTGNTIPQYLQDLLEQQNSKQSVARYDQRSKRKSNKTKRAIHKLPKRRPFQLPDTVKFI